MFIRRTLVEYPKQKHTADALGEVEADDGHRYYVKDDSNGVPTRASEWICSQMAEAVGIATPAAMPIALQSGRSVFGSRRIAGVADDALTAAHLTQSTIGNVASISSIGLKTVLSSIYAFDMFFYNDDRHLGNYLSVDDNGTRRLYTFDFSRALFWRWPWSGYPPTGCNTRQFGTLLRQLHGFDQTVAIGTLDRIAGLSPDLAARVIGEMPDGWLSAELTAQFSTWWAAAHRASRVSGLKQGLSDGTLL
jgi:hypothetical protein